MGLVGVFGIYLRLVSGHVTDIISTSLISIFATYIIFLVLRFWIRRRTTSQLPHLRIPLANGKRPLLIGFFHPYCNAGGGGERVLWIAIRALQRRYEHIRCIVYTGDIDATRDEILERARQRFNLVLPRTGPNDIHFAFLRRRLWVEANRYPFFTLLGQSLGSLVLGWEALLSCVPDIYFDSMGYAFTLPLFRYFGGCKTGCYAHYPTISTDMLDRVVQRRADYNNASFVSNSAMLSRLKLVYYRLFAWVYGVAGRRSHLILVNSTWTQGHILSLWRAPNRTFVLYPPCDVAEFLSLPLQIRKPGSLRSIVSIGQFRPEKDHRLQLVAFSKFLAMVPSDQKSLFRLLLVGGCRNEEDAVRVNALRKFSEELNIAQNVEFRLNASFDELKQCLLESDVGLHTMRDEHFGIGVVECMAAGTVVLAYNSAGPKMDIVVDHNGQRTGFLADSADSYAVALDYIFKQDSEELIRICMNARESVKRFSDVEFEQQFIGMMEPLIIVAS